MKLLVVGGSGLVGSLIVPTLAEKHQIRVYDLKPPAFLETNRADHIERPGSSVEHADGAAERPAGAARHADDVEYVQGSVDDFHAVRQAADGMDVVVYLAMNPMHTPDSPPEEIRSSLAFDVNVKGPYLTYWAAAEAGVRHAVHASSLSVYPKRDYYPSEDDPPDSNSIYGLTKRLGEEICRHAADFRSMSVNALRLCHPTPDDEWPPPGDDHNSIIATRASDLAAAFEAALHYRDGFQAFFISGDSDERHTPLGKAKRLLGWAPTPRPQPSP